MNKKIEKIELVQNDFLPGRNGAAEISEKINEIVDVVNDNHFAIRSAGGKARAASLSSEDRKTIASNAAKARWNKGKKEDK